jgi:hypothetical protein
MVDRFKMSPDEREVERNPYEDAIKLLSGTIGNFVFCWAAFLAALVLTAISVYKGLGCTGVCYPGRCSAGTFLFLGAQSVALVKLVQDYHDAKVGKETSTAELAFLQPTNAYAAQCVLFYVVALGCVLYSVGVFFTDATNGFDTKWRNLFLVQVFWLSSATVNLTKAIKDKRDSRLWREVPDEHRSEKIDHIVDTAKGACAYLFFAAISILVAIGATMLTLFYVFMSVNPIIRLCWLGCYAASIVQCFSFVKLDHDRVQLPAVDRRRFLTPFYQLSTVVTFLGAAGATIGFGVFLVINLVMMNKEFEAEHLEMQQDALPFFALRLPFMYQTLSIITMSIFTVTSFLTGAKLVRDHWDAVEVKTSAGQFDVSRYTYRK